MNLSFNKDVYPSLNEAYPTPTLPWSNPLLMAYKSSLPQSSFLAGLSYYLYILRRNRKGVQNKR